MVEVVRRRLLHGFGANAVGSVVTTLIQLVAVPILIQSWGARLYGEWLVLIAIPTFFLMADWGFENVAGNEMILAGEEKEKGIEVYKTLQMFVALASIALVVLIALSLQLLPIAKWLVPGGLDERVVTIILVTLTIHVSVAFQGGLIRASLRSTGNYALGVMYQNFTRAGDALAVNITALAGGGLVAASFAMLGSRIIMTTVAYLHMRKLNPSMSSATARSNGQTLRRLGPEILAMMAFPLGFALSLQGTVTIIGLLLGPVAVVTFATLRTLSRFVFTLGGVISNATWPEASFAFSSSNIPLARALHRRGFQAVGWLTISLAIATIVMAPFLLKAWTRGVVSFNALMLGTLLIVAVIDASWTASSVVAMAAGKYRGISIMYALCTAMSLVAAGITLRAFGVESAPVALLAGSLVMLPFVLRRSLRLTDDHFAAFVRFVMKPPKPGSLFRRRIAEAAEAMPS